ncbi:hypothetical protein E2C01_062624 [Portunus trituberculatus]|uniref:Uncharacterized protein n=1 Tax=Portunus trituberculatus TaxID=210409 RepID=A0A5B7HE69_PORTR|nr:hypothetical protein [Portunus trituberculatus]
MPWCATMLSYSHEPLHSIYCTVFPTLLLPQSGTGHSPLLTGIA